MIIFAKIALVLVAISLLCSAIDMNFEPNVDFSKIGLFFGCLALICSLVSLF